MSTNFTTITLVTAPRKPRTCFWCREPLPAGRPVMKIAGKWEGTFDVLYVHPECNAAWRRDPCNDDEGCTYEHLRGKTCYETTDWIEGRTG